MGQLYLQRVGGGVWAAYRGHGRKSGKLLAMLPGLGFTGRSKQYSTLGAVQKGPPDFPSDYFTFLCNNLEATSWEEGLCFGNSLG